MNHPTTHKLALDEGAELLFAGHTEEAAEPVDFAGRGTMGGIRSDIEAGNCGVAMTAAQQQLCLRQLQQQSPLWLLPPTDPSSQYVVTPSMFRMPAAHPPSHPAYAAPSAAPASGSALFPRQQLLSHLSSQSFGAIPPELLQSLSSLHVLPTSRPLPLPPSMQPNVKTIPQSQVHGLDAAQLSYLLHSTNGVSSDRSIQSSLAISKDGQTMVQMSLHRNARVRAKPKKTGRGLSSQKLWTKYGRKKVQRCRPDHSGKLAYIGNAKRSYFKCFNKECNARMYVDIDEERGEESLPVMLGEHTHTFELCLDREKPVKYTHTHTQVV